MPRLATAACVRMLAIVVGFALMEPDLLLAVIGPNDPASAEANTEWATVPDFVMRAPGRPGGFPFVDFYENESVSVASGGLVVAHPASPVYPLNGGQRLGLTRTYSSKICREDVYTREWIDDVGDTHHDHVHVWRGNSWAGFGWSFHLGRISYQSEKADPSDKDYANFLHFVEPDGTDHRLYEVVTDEFGTADGSYIRAARDPNDVYRVYFPDGRWLRLEKISDPTTTDIGRHHSNHIVTNPETHGWYTVEAGRGPHSLYTADYQKSDGYGHPEGLRSIHDNTGRQISFEIFVDPNRDPNQPAVDPSLYGMLKKVKTPAFGDRIADYDFEYNTFATDSNRDGATNLPLLTEVALPEGFSIGYEYADIALTPLISRIVHPSHSVSQFSWTGQDYSRGATSTGNSFGVSRRQVLDGQGNSFSWFFQRNVVNPASGRRDDVTLTDPYGNVTEYLLNADPNRPFSGRVSQVTVHQGGLNGPIASQTVSETMLACSASSKIVNYGPGTLLEADVRPFKVESRTFNVADANDVATVVRESSDWDGMGHFYKARVSGTGVKGYSETFTKWTADPNATNPASWLLDTFAYRDISNGGTRSRIGASFDAEGRLAETRAYRNIVGVNLDGGVSISSICECGRGGCPPCAPDPWTPPPSPPTCGLTPTFVVPADPNGPDPDDDLDLITTNTFESATGNLVSSTRHFQSSDSVPNWNDPVQTNIGYEVGAAQAVDVAGVPFHLTNDTLDLTGLVRTSFDSAGVRVDYAYDTLGRLTTATPPPAEEAATRLIRSAASEPLQSTVTIRGGNGSDQFEPGSSAQLYEKESYDGLGRTTRVERAMPGGERSVRETAYSPLGRVVFVSEWIRDLDLAAAPRTTYEKVQSDPASNPNIPDDSWSVSVPLDPNGRVWGTRIFYGEPIISDPENPLAVSWDPLNRLHAIVGFDGATTTASYGALNQAVTVKGARVASATSALGDPNTVDVTTTYWSDGLGRMLMVDEPSGSADALYGYDLFGNRSRVNLITQLPADPWADYDTALNGPGQSRSFLFDGLGHLIESSNPENGRARNDQFNVRGQPTVSQDARGASRGYHLAMIYDLAGRPASATRLPDNGVSTGNLLNETFATGIPSTWHGETDPNSDPNAWTWHKYLSGENCNLPGSGSVVRVGGSSCGYGGALYGKDQLVTPAIGADPNHTYTIPVSGLTVLTFRYWRDVRNTSRDAVPARMDKTYVEVEDVTAGSTMKRVFYLDSTAASTKWWEVSPEIDLSEFKDHVIRLHFVFERTDQGDTTPRPGWALDYVKVTTKSSDLLWEQVYDQSYCATAGIFAQDLCAENTGLAERSLGNLSEVKSYQDGGLLSDKYLVYQGPSGRLSSWLERIYRRGSSSTASEDFVGRMSYDSLGEEVGLRAPQRIGEASRNYTLFRDRGAVVRLGQVPDPAEYLVTVERNPGGGVSRLIFPTGALETVDYDSAYRTRRIRVESFVPPVAGDDFNNNHGQQATRQVVFDSGTYQYDGAGNIAGVGSDRYLYDGGMRLHGALVKGHELDLGHDPFGNVLNSHMPFESPANPDVEIASRSYTVPASSPAAVDNLIHDSGFRFDENGNLLEEPARGSTPARRYVFDGRDQLREVWWSDSAQGFILTSRAWNDAAGLRVTKEDLTKADRLTYYLRGFDGDVLSEYVLERGPGEGPYRSKEYLTGLGRPLGVNLFCGPPPQLTGPGWTVGEDVVFQSSVSGSLAGVTGYELEIEAIGWHRILTVSPDSTGAFSVAASNFSPDYTSYVRLRALAACGESVWSKQVEISTETSSESPYIPPVEFDTAEPMFLHVDHLGSVRVETDHAGFMAARRDFYPFGQVIAPQPGGENTHLFTGHERDSETGMDYMRARYHAGWQARFLSQDSVGGFVANPQSWNLATYVRDNPVNFWDPTGLTLSQGWRDGGGGGWDVWGECVRSPLTDEKECSFFSWSGGWGDSDQSGGLAGGGGGGRRNVRRHAVTKEQCVQNLLEDKFGFLVADVVIPEFSVYSVANNLQAVGVGVAVSLGLKAALSSGQIAYGKFLGSQGTFLADYSWKASASAELLEEGLAWKAAGVTTGAGLLGVSGALTLFSSAAEYWARQQCGDVQ